MSEQEEKYPQHQPEPLGEPPEQHRDDYKFGSWPEAAGLVFTALLCWLIVVFTG